MHLKEKIQKYINKEGLFSEEDKIILAISGGADSIFLMHIFLELGVKFELAHCNFKLREKESDDDEIFVKNIANKYKLKLNVKSFTTLKYAEEKKMSIQMAARDLRYKWFNHLLITQKAKYIATAHHQDDTIETFFINLIRGAGISGLSSISSSNTSMNVIRPLLQISRMDIVNYLLKRNLLFREDSSNKSIKYLRNNIRHNLVPLLEDMNPNIKEIILQEINIFKKTLKIFSNHIEDIRERLVDYSNGIFSIRISQLKDFDPLDSYLFEILKPFNFGFNQIESIIKVLNKSSSGKKFISYQYELLIDREYIFIRSIGGKNINIKKIQVVDKLITSPISLLFSVSKHQKLNCSENIAQLDYDKLIFPLELRKWRSGDKFKPLGMRTYKKLSDFFIDNKFSLFQKEKQWLLCSGEQIVWVIGFRIDNRFKVTSTTKKLYIAELLNN